MIKLRACDRNTKHVRGRIVLSEDRDIIFPSSEEMFLRKLEEKISEACKGFKYSGIEVEHFTIEIK